MGTIMILLGSIVNFATVAVGAMLGSLFGKALPRRITDAMLAGMALCVLYVGLDGLGIGTGSINFLTVIISVGIGVLIGELLDIDRYLQRFGAFLQRKLGGTDGTESRMGKAFVTTTLLFCIGAMAINGSLESAQNVHKILLVKSVIDGIVCLVMSATLGIGCILSAVSVFIYQGSLTLIFYSIISSINSESVLYITTVNHITCVGSLIIIAIGLNMLGLTKIKTANCIPAMALPLIICPIMNALGIL